MTEEHNEDGQPADLPHTGRLGMSPEVAEAERISQLPPRGAIAVRETESPQDIQTRAQIQTQVGVVLRSEMGAVRAVVNELIHDIRTNTEALKLADVPLEQVANSHERAAASFETLRAEIASVAGRLAGVEKVIDTAGLRRAQDGAEARFIRLADLLERTIQELVTLQGGALEAARARLQKASKPRSRSKKRKS